MQRKGPLYILPWRCTFACNFDCVHCTSAGKPAAQDEVSTEEAKRIVDQAYEFGASFFGITGGEPFLRKDLFDIIRYARKTGLNTSIITDGRLVDDQASENIVRNEVRVSVSIDGGKDTDDLVRWKGAYAAALKLIQKLSRDGLLNCLVYTLANVNESVTNVNENDFIAVLDLAEKYGARWVIYHGMIPYSKEKASLKACPSPRQNEWAWNKLYDLQSVYKEKPAINV